MEKNIIPAITIRTLHILIMVLYHSSKFLCKSIFSMLTNITADSFDIKHEMTHAELEIKNETKVGFTFVFVQLESTINII